MKVAVWDTYVKKKNGTIMNFDIMVPDSQKKRNDNLWIRERILTK